MRVIETLADARRTPTLVEIEGPVTPRGTWGRAKLTYRPCASCAACPPPDGEHWLEDCSRGSTHDLLHRIERLKAINPWEERSKYSSLARRIGALVYSHGMDIYVYAPND